MIIGAHELVRTRLCASFGCGDEAENGSILCGRCQRAGERPAPPPPDPACDRMSDLADHLWCSGPCGDLKPDGEFHVRGRGDAAPGRRGRRSQCKECEAVKRRLNRAADDDYNDKQTLRRRARS